MKKLFTILTLLLFIGCTSKPLFYPVDFNQKLAIGTPGVTIKAKDGSFTWESGQTYDLPADIRGGEWSSLNGPLAISTSEISDVNRNAAIEVFVETPNMKEPLHGLLQVSRIISECRGKEPATRSYYIQIPQSYVLAAEGGKVSVVYESYMCPTGYYKNNTTGPASRATGHSTWVMWLSDIPF